MSKGLLKNVTVLDLTRVLAGPYCGMMLADMGADVIKIELPGRGDDSRALGPFVNGESAYFMNLNRNKRGMTLNLKHEEGKRIFKALVKQSDIILESYRPGVMKRLGLDYKELRKINPSIIYGAVSGFGQYGPYAKRTGYDILGQAVSGLMSTTGWPNGKPTRTGTAMSDVLGGMSVCIGVLAAYINRLKTGQGEMVDVSLVDATVSSLEVLNMIYLCTGRIPDRTGNRYEVIAPYDSFQAKDGMVVITCGNDSLFAALKQVLQMPELDNEQFSSNALRTENHTVLKKLIERWTIQRPAKDIVDALLTVGVPVAPINTIDQVVKDPHIAGAREMFVPLPHPVAGDMKVTGNQVKLSNQPIQIVRPAPTLGQHTEEILAEKLGIDHERYMCLVNAGVF